MEPSTIVQFSAASLALLLIPGPSVTYIVARSIQGGRKVGLASVAGVHVGTVVHVMAAVVGLSALLVSSAAAYNAVRIGGGCYLIYLGVRAFRRPAETTDVEVRPAPGALHALRQGIVVNVLNPKTAIFFLAYLPQFVRPGDGPPALQLMALGGIFIALGVITDGLYALSAAEMGRRIGGRRWVRRRDQAAGAVYIGLGLLTLASPGRRTG